MSRKAITALAAALALSAGLQAQNTSDLRIGEVLVENTSGLLDDFGQRNGWIEIYNNSDGTVKFGGCYLTDDKSDLKKYRIPSNDASAAVKPHQSAVFFASGKAASGTYYTNFTIERGETVYIVSNDGKTIIDALTVPSDLQADKSVMRVPGGVKGTDLKTVSNAAPTPGGFNGDVEAKSKSETIKEKDPKGFVLTLISVTIVFLALFLLSFVFDRIGKVQNKAPRAKKKRSSGSPAATEEIAAAIAMALSRERCSEVQAAIALALHLHLREEVHDKESFVLTIRQTVGSQWNNKALGFRRMPRK